MSEDEIIIEYIKKEYGNFDNYVRDLLDLYQKEKEKNIILEGKNIGKQLAINQLQKDIEEQAKNSISKDKIRDKQIEREFELQQEYKDFEDDIQWKTYKELLEEE